MSIRKFAGCVNAHISSILTMSAPSKSNTPTPVTASQSKDWMKAATPELNAGMDDKTEVVMAKQAKTVQAGKVGRIGEAAQGKGGG